MPLMIQIEAHAHAHAHTHTRTRTHAHAHAHARTHARTHTTYPTIKFFARVRALTHFLLSLADVAEMCLLRVIMYMFI